MQAVAVWSTSAETRLGEFAGRLNPSELADLDRALSLGPRPLLTTACGLRLPLAREGLVELPLEVGNPARVEWSRLGERCLQLFRPQYRDALDGE